MLAASVSPCLGVLTVCFMASNVHASFGIVKLGAVGALFHIWIGVMVHVSAFVLMAGRLFCVPKMWRWTLLKYCPVSFFLSSNSLEHHEPLPFYAAVLDVL